MALPPRHVETLIIPFANESEKMIYEHIENRNTEHFLKLRGDSPASVLEKYSELNGMLVSARQACGHLSCLHLDDLNNLNEKLEREARRAKEREMQKRGLYLNELSSHTKKDDMTRSDVFQQAVSKARAAARIRMREVVAHIQSSEIEYIECSICFDAITEKDVALTVRHFDMFR